MLPHWVQLRSRPTRAGVVVGVVIDPMIGGVVVGRVRETPSPSTTTKTTRGQERVGDTLKLVGGGRASGSPELPLGTCQECIDAPPVPRCAVGDLHEPVTVTVVQSGGEGRKPVGGTRLSLHVLQPDAGGHAAWRTWQARAGGELQLPCGSVRYARRSSSTSC